MSNVVETNRLLETGDYDEAARIMWYFHDTLRYPSDYRNIVTFVRMMRPDDWQMFIEEDGVSRTIKKNYNNHLARRKNQR